MIPFNNGSVDRGDEVNEYSSHPQPTVLTPGESSQQHVVHARKESLWLSTISRRAPGGTAPSGAVGFEAAVVRTEVLGQVGVITLDDERRRNALSAQMANGIVAALEGLRAMDVRAVVLRAAPSARASATGALSTAAGNTEG